MRPGAESKAGRGFGEGFCTGLAAAVALTLCLAASSAPAQGALLGEEQKQALLRSLPSEWTTTVGKTRVSLTLTPDGRFVLDGKEGQYALEGTTLTLRNADGEAQYTLGLTGDVLTLSGGDLPQALTFSRQAEFGGFLERFLRVSPRAARTKAIRIGSIVLVALFTSIAMRLLRAGSRVLIFSDAGPLRYLYRQHKQRAMTIHLLVLNALKYIVYFAAFGFILAELGVNYRAYLASLSVIGLAVGFGSQGLVQDVVTGFFLIFESQFDVGDMVEISGQTGVVQEVGLRMTKLRNYLGQVVTIPNRNIAMVGTYDGGALQAVVDVAAAGVEEAKRQAPLVQKVAEEAARQFEGVVLDQPRVDAPLSLGTGEHFVRLYMAVWPGQQWLVEQQVVPRLREAMQREKLTIPADRVAVFYHGTPRTRPVTVKRLRLRRPVARSGDSTARAGTGKAARREQ